MKKVANFSVGLIKIVSHNESVVTQDSIFRTPYTLTGCGPKNEQVVADSHHGSRGVSTHRLPLCVNNRANLCVKLFPNHDASSSTRVGLIAEEGQNHFLDIHRKVVRRSFKVDRVKDNALRQVVSREK